MMKINYVVLLIVCFLILSLITDSPIFLSAQTGWSEDRRLVFLPGGGWYPRAACYGDTIHLVWYQRYPMGEEVFYKRSIDTGLTWSSDLRLSIEDAQSSVLPWITANDNYIHVVWQQEDVGICYRKSIDGGNSWLSIDTIPSGGSGQPSICAVDSNIYVVAYRTDGKIIFSKSTNNGDTWLPSQVINFNSATQPRIKYFNSDPSILILICQNTTSSVEIYFKRTTDAGATWSDSQVVSHYDSIHSFRPAMTIDDSDGIHVLWCDYKYSPYAWTGDIFYLSSKDTGQTWAEIDSLTVEHRAVISDIFSEANNLHLVWEDDRHDFNNNFEIYYRMSTDLGQTWLPEVRLTDTLYWSICPSLACGGNYLHLFWRDCRDDTSNAVGAIYYKQKDLLVPVDEKIKASVVTKLIFDVYPNPFTDKLNIKLLSFLRENPEIKIFDILGKEVMVYVVKDKTGGIKVNTRNLPCGVYFIETKAGSESLIKKTVKIR